MRWPHENNVTLACHITPAYYAVYRSQNCHIGKPLIDARSALLLMPPGYATVTPASYAIGSS